MKKRVVYTSVIGHYDILPEPTCPNKSGIDFVCFTDRDDLKSTTWQIKKVESTLLGRVRDSRRIKLQPHIFLPDHEESLYIDNTLRLLQDPADIMDKYLTDDTDFTLWPHPVVDCLYDEGEIIIYYSVGDDEERVREQLNFYHAQGYPEHSGHFASGILMRRHRKAELVKFHDLWFSHVLRYSRRDQLSLPFCARHLGIQITPIKNGTMYDNDVFEWVTSEVRRIPYGLDKDTFIWLNPDLRGQVAVEKVEEYLYQGGYKENRPHFYQRPLKLDMLANKYKSGQGRLSFNRHYYTRIYQQYLSALQEEVFELLELGWGRHGLPPSPEGHDAASSLKMWSEFFPNARITGLEQQAFIGRPDAGFKTIQADIASKKTLEKTLTDQSFRIIIADGSSYERINCLPSLWPHLEPGGMLFVEDMVEELPENVVADLKAQGDVADIVCYDSMDYKWPNYGRDALALITKAVKARIS